MFSSVLAIKFQMGLTSAKSTVRRPTFGNNFTRHDENIEFQSHVGKFSHCSEQEFNSENLHSN